MQGTEEPSRILPQIVKAGGKCDFSLVFLLNLALISFSVYIKLPQLQSCTKQAASHANLLCWVGFGGVFWWGFS